jgi:hypothetical protein
MPALITGLLLCGSAEKIALEILKGMKGLVRRACILSFLEVEEGLPPFSILSQMIVRLRRLGTSFFVAHS